MRNVGPVGGPGMPEMVMLTIQLQGRGLGEDVALITDGRFSGVSHGILIGHISPEAARGGPIAAVRDGDTIVIDPGARTLNLDVPDAEIARRMADWRAPDPAGRVRPGLGPRQVHPAGVVGAPRLRGVNGVPERIRTSDLRFRKPLLYPAELRGRGGFLAYPRLVWKCRAADQRQGQKHHDGQQGIGELPVGERTRRHAAEIGQPHPRDRRGLGGSGPGPVSASR